MPKSTHTQAGQESAKIGDILGKTISGVERVFLLLYSQWHTNIQKVHRDKPPWEFRRNDLSYKTILTEKDIAKKNFKRTKPQAKE